MEEAKRLQRNQERLKECYGPFAQAVKALLEDLQAHGFRPRIQDAWRSPEDQEKAFNSGHSQLKFGFHNVTGSDGRKETLAVDILDDDNPLAPPSRYLLALTAFAQDHGLETGILWGLNDGVRQGTLQAIRERNFDAPVKVGWDPCHVQVAGITPEEAKQGKRPEMKVMAVLAVGSSGPQVVRLQEKLQALGFNPGKIDGIFGLGTEASVLAFQKSKGLLADGIAGPHTLRALELAPAAALPTAMSHVTVDLVSKMFPRTPLDNIKKHLPVVLKALAEVQLVDKPMVLMALATIRAETAGFEPISEFLSRFNTSPGGHPFDLYDQRQDLGNQGRPDGESFKGRGFIQLTGRFNYQKHGESIGLGNGLVENPELANDPEIAAKLLASFLKDKERLIKEALLDGNLATARRLVNGGRHGLEAFSEAFNTGDTLLSERLRTSPGEGVDDEA
jgi:putative chitinase